MNIEVVKPDRPEGPFRANFILCKNEGVSPGGEPIGPQQPET